MILGCCLVTLASHVSLPVPPNSHVFIGFYLLLSGSQVSNFSKTLNIAVIGEVSSGKSSLINALLRRNKDNLVTAVGAKAGVTTELKVINLDERVRLVDSPGLADIQAENSEITKEFLKHVDVGILVITGACNTSQKTYLDDLQKKCDKVFVVLNKIDHWKDFEPSTLDDIIQQWRKALQEKIYPVCTFGFDPQTRESAISTLQGVDELRKDIESFLASQGKDLLLARQMAEKKSYAAKIITAALTTVGTEAFFPASSISITATQVTAIASLYYLYTGEILSQKTAFALIPTFAAKATGCSLFLAAKSLLPPTGLVDVAAAGIAITITLAMLATVNHLLASGCSIQEEERLRATFYMYRKQAELEIANLVWNPGSILCPKAILERFL